jgi:hypothetical protein
MANIMSAASQSGAVLQGYAERRVFKEYRAPASKNEQSHFDFDWLYRQPFSIIVDGKRRRLVLAGLLPGVRAMR